MYDLEVCERVDRIFRKIAKKERLHHEAIEKKVEQILENPHRFDELHAPMQGRHHVHVMSSFVLIYSIDEKRKTVVILDYGHHDKVFRANR